MTRHTTQTRTRPTTGHVGPREPGPHGLTLQARADDLHAMLRTVEPREPRDRDRTLRGKDRRVVRKYSQRMTARYAAHRARGRSVTESWARTEADVSEYRLAPLR